METNLNEIVESNFLELAYRKKYNLTFNDERILKACELDFEMDLRITKKFDEKVEKARKRINLERDFGEEEIEEFLDIGEDISDEEIEEFMADDSVYDKEIQTEETEEIEKEETEEEKND